MAKSKETNMLFAWWLLLFTWLTFQTSALEFLEGVPMIGDLVTFLNGLLVPVWLVIALVVISIMILMRTRK